MHRRATPPKRVTSPTWGPPPLCKQALNTIETCDCSSAQSIPLADPEKGPGGPGARPPLDLSTKMRPEGPKKISWETTIPPYLRVYMTAPYPPPPPPGSATLHWEFL